VTGHPLDRYADKVAELATHDSGNLEGLNKGAEVALCGVLTGITRRRNREGKPWAAMMIEDRNGSVEALVFAGSFERLAPLVWKTRRWWCAGWRCRKRAARRRSQCRRLWL